MTGCHTCGFSGRHPGLFVTKASLRLPDEGWRSPTWGAAVVARERVGTDYRPRLTPNLTRSIIMAYVAPGIEERRDLVAALIPATGALG